MDTIFSRFSCQYTQIGVARPEQWFRKNVRIENHMGAPYPCAATVATEAAPY